MGFQAGINFYAYVNNNPINLNDPMGMEPGDFFDSNNWDVARGEVIANQVFKDAQGLALILSNGDRSVANQLLLNGPVDAWRHAEWQRRTSEEMNTTFAWLAGTQHEIKNLWDYATGKNPRNLTFDQQMQETWMDLSNNFVGREAARSGLSTIDENLPLTIGKGGNYGQPDASFSSYQSVQFWTGLSDFRGSGAAASGGFVLYPNKPNTNFMSRIYSK